MSNVKEIKKILYSLVNNNKPDGWGSCVIKDYVGGGSFGEVFEIEFQDPKPDFYEEGFQYVIKYIDVRYTMGDVPGTLRNKVISREVREIELLYANKIEEQYLSRVYYYKSESSKWLFLIEKKFDSLREGITVCCGSDSVASSKLDGDGIPCCDETFIFKLAGDLLESLDYLHNTMHYFHRDIKPENIMYDAVSNRFMMIDFNTAKEFSRIDYCATRSDIVGTPICQAPEYSDYIEPIYNPSMDIYSLGSTLYYVLTGEYPNTYAEKEIVEQYKPVVELLKEHPENDDELIRQSSEIVSVVENKLYSLLEQRAPDLSKQLKWIILSSVSLDTNKRYTRVSFMLHDLKIAAQFLELEKQLKKIREEELGNKDNQIRKLRGDVEKLKERITHYKSVENENNDTITKLGREKQEIDTLYIELKTRLDEIDTVLSDAEKVYNIHGFDGCNEADFIRKLNIELSNTSSKEDIETLEKRIEGINRLYIDKSIQCEAAEKKVEELQNNVDSIKENYKQQIEGKDRLLEERNSVISILEQQSSSYESKNKILKTENRKQQEEIEKVKNDAERMKTELEIKTNESIENERRLRKEIIELKQRLRDMENSQSSQQDEEIETILSYFKAFSIQSDVFSIGSSSQNRTKETKELFDISKNGLYYYNDIVWSEDWIANPYSLGLDGKTQIIPFSYTMNGNKINGEFRIVPKDTKGTICHLGVMIDDALNINLYIGNDEHIKGRGKCKIKGL